MFCVKCGAQISDESKVCEKCGAAQKTAPDYEYKTVRCYPSDSTENKYKMFYESCGWKITDIDRRQTYDGQSFDGTQNYSTQTHIKMQRDKNMPNYDKIRELSEKAEGYFDTVPNKKRCASWLAIGIFAIIVGTIACIMASMLGLPFYAFIVAIVIGVCCLIPGILRIKSNKKVEAQYYANKAIADKALEECKALVRKSKQL